MITRDELLIQQALGVVDIRFRIDFCRSCKDYSYLIPLYLTASSYSGTVTKVVWECYHCGWRKGGDGGYDPR